MTTTQLRALVEQRDAIQVFIESDDPDKKGGYSLVNISNKEQLAERILELLPAYLTSQAEREEQLVETAVETFRKDVDNNFCDMSSDTKITSAIRILRAVLAPSLSAVLARMEGEES